MAELLRNGRFIDDSSEHVSDDDPLPNDNIEIFVSLNRWLGEKNILLGRRSRVGIALANTTDPAELVGNFDAVPVVSIEFPKFEDGRAYSKARLLRERYKYLGEIRAVGEVLVDQLFFLRRCGFDTFALNANQYVPNPEKYFEKFSVAYQ